MLKIGYTIIDGNCADLTETEVEAYAEAVEAAIQTAYPSADVAVDIVWNTAGIGGGFDVREVDSKGYEIEPGEGDHDLDAVKMHLASVAEKIFEQGGALFTLYWTREDKQGDFNMGSFQTKAEAEAAIPAAKAELMGQCGEDFQRQQIEDGSWSIQETIDE